MEWGFTLKEKSGGNRISLEKNHLVLAKKTLDARPFHCLGKRRLLIVNNCYKAENNDADDVFLRELIHPKLSIQLLLRFKHVHE